MTKCVLKIIKKTSEHNTPNRMSKQTVSADVHAMFTKTPVVEHETEQSLHIEFDEETNVKLTAPTSFHKPNSSGLRIPKKARTIVIGDSNLKKVNSKRLDQTGKTFVKSIAGLTIESLTDIISSTQTCTEITRIVAHVGTNDIDMGKSETSIMENMKTLASQIGKTFPEATLAFTGIIPQKGKKLLDISSLNDQLKHYFNELGIDFIFQKRDFFARNAFPSHLFNKDKYHLNERGIGVLLREIKGWCFVDNEDRSRTNVIVRTARQTVTTDSSPHKIDRTPTVEPRPNLQVTGVNENNQSSLYPNTRAYAAVSQTSHVQEQTAPNGVQTTADTTMHGGETRHPDPRLRMCPPIPHAMPMPHPWGMFYPHYGQLQHWQQPFFPNFPYPQRFPSALAPNMPLMPPVR